MATAWLCASLNRLPGTRAVHSVLDEALLDTPPETSLIERLQKISGGGDVTRCGLVARGEQVFSEAHSGAFSNTPLSIAQLFRNPVMLADDSIARSLAVWDTPKKKALLRRINEMLATDRYLKAHFAWPESLKTFMREADETARTRFAAVWSRTHMAAREALYYDAFVERLRESGQTAREREYPLFRYEDYTSDFSRYRALVDHFTLGQYSDDAVRDAFETPVLNRHRLNGNTDPAEVYASWSEE